MSFKVLCITALMCGAWTARPAQAATFTVDSPGDIAPPTPNGICGTGAGTCTLREAIIEANNTVAADIIAFNLAGPFTITPTQAATGQSH